MEAKKDLALPKGSLILITGANGHVASNIVHEALQLGYRVRGSVRSAEKASQIKKIFPSDDYTSIIVPDLSEAGAFDEAVRGVDGIIHVATTTSFDPDPNKVIPITIAGATGILKSALKEPTVKSFVYTGTIPISMNPDPHYVLNASSWADDAVEQAWAPPPYTPERGFAVYKASKDLAERAIWEFVKTEKPHFLVNSVLPTTVFGRIVSSPSITGQWPIEVMRGTLPPGSGIQSFVDMMDTARIHLAALMDRTVKNERVIASASPYKWNDMIDVIHKLRPEAKLPSHIPNEGSDLGKHDNKIGAALLVKWWGQDGYTGFEESIRRNLEGEY